MRQKGIARVRSGQANGRSEIMEREDIVAALPVPRAEGANPERDRILSLVQATLDRLSRDHVEIGLWEKDCLVGALGALASGFTELAKTELALVFAPSENRSGEYIPSPERAAHLERISPQDIEFALHALHYSLLRLRHH